MTEIVQNNNSMKFDLLEPGNSGTEISGSGGLFNSLLGSVDTHSEDDFQEFNELENKDTIADGNIFQILNLLQKSELNLTKDTLNNIKKSLKVATKMQCVFSSFYFLNEVYIYLPFCA